MKRFRAIPLLPRLCLTALVLLALSACMPSGVKRWAGDYVAGARRLQLRATGEFDYVGGACFPADSDSDVGFSDDASGRFRVDGHWIVLEAVTIPAPCSGITERLYARRVDGHRYLLDEHYVRSIAHEVRIGAPPGRLYPWHIAGEPAEIDAGAHDWLPQPYAAWTTMPPPSGCVVEIGPVQRRTRYGSAGRVEGEENFAILTLDFGQRHGAFPGMPVCVPGQPRRYWLQAATEHTSTLRSAWAPSGEGAPEVGMVLTSECR
jgi:hypothetical protein